LSWDGRIQSAITTIFDKKVRLVNVYFPNTNGSRASIAKYKEALTVLDNALLATRMPTIIAGDLNVIFNKSLDAETPNPSSYFPSLVQKWEDIISKHALRDVWREINPEEQGYTFTPGGRRGRSVFRRLDYVLISESLMPWIQSMTMRHTHLSDHKLLRIELRPKNIKPPFRIWKHKDGLLEDKEYIDALGSSICAAVEDSQELSSAKSRWEYIKYKTRQRARALEKEVVLRERAERNELQAFVNANMGNRSNDQEKKDALVRLNQLEAEATDRLRLAARVRWVEHNERSTSYFFNRIKQNSADSNIIALSRDNLQLSDQEINQEIHRFYSTLYSARATIDLRGSWRRRAEEMDVLSPEEKTSLGRPISINELDRSVFKLMKAGKAPGNDGLTVKLYRTFWNQLKTPLFEALAEGVADEALSPSQRQAVIRLIRKKDKDPTLLKNWRPISLMNVDTKILSSALADRLKPLIPKLISKEQLGFVQGRLITDGTKLLRYITEEASKHDKSTILAAIDHER
jgi:hypothetical protein